MSESSKAVFLSYASQDAEAARRICETLRGEGVEVWFDADGGLEHGDEWDAKIRKQIKECVLFIPIISANTQAREEGYFRLEWDLASERARTIASGVPFILPVVIDDTREPDALVPDRFRMVQWTKLPGGVVTPEVKARYLKLWSHRIGAVKYPQLEPGRPRPGEHGEGAASPAQAAVGRRVPAAAWIGGVVMATAAIVAFLALRPKPNAGAGPRPPTTEKSTVGAVKADEKSIAVLAFDNRSDDKEAEYLGEGISADLIAALGRVPGLVVRGSTSAFYFKGKNATAREIGEQLRVTFLLRGSVQKSGPNVRITAQLTRAANDRIEWALEPITKELKDVFALQDEIVGRIARNLSLRLGAASAVRREVNPEAYRLLLEGRHFWSLRSADGLARAETLLTRAAALDPDWAPVQEALGDLWVIRALYRGLAGEPFEEERMRGQAAARRALELDPSLAQPHATLGLAVTLVKSRPDWAEAERELLRAIQLAPNNAIARDWYGDVLQESGHMDRALAEYRSAAQLDPLALFVLSDLGWKLINARRYAEAFQVLDRANTLYPGRVRIVMQRAEALVGLGRHEEARTGVRAVIPALTNGEDIYRSGEAIHFMKQIGLMAEARDAAQRLLAQHPRNHFLRGAILLGSGQLDEAFALLEEPPVFVNRFLFYDPQFDPVRGDPRWMRLMEKRACAAEYQLARESLARLIKEANQER